MIFNRYAVPPFSQKPPFRKDGHPDDGYVCGICMQPVKEPLKHWAVVTDGGARWGTAQDYQEGDKNTGFMGCFPIGPNCHKRHFQDNYEVNDAS